MIYLFFEKLTYVNKHVKFNSKIKITTGGKNEFYYGYWYNYYGSGNHMGNLFSDNKKTTLFFHGHLFVNREYIPHIISNPIIIIPIIIIKFIFPPV